LCIKALILHHKRAYRDERKRDKAHEYLVHR
jgi:hypothetical protein